MNRRAAVLSMAGAGSVLMAAKPGAARVSDEMFHGDLHARAGKVLDAWLKAWNASDLDAMFALFTDDAHWVNIVGMHWRGKAEVERAHRVFFDVMFKGVPQSLEEIESVVPLLALARRKC
jgi:ketosteroid isomerase-like protein